MPILTSNNTPIAPAREATETRIQRQTQPVNFMIGTATPRMERVDRQIAKGGLGDFISGFWSTFSAGLEKNKRDARAQGAIDAQTYNDPLDNVKQTADKQSFLVKDDYRNGFIEAAVAEKLTEFQQGAASRAMSSGLMGLTDEEYIEQEKQHTANQMQSLVGFTELSDFKTKEMIARTLQQSAEANYKTMSKARQGQALVVAERGLVKNGISVSEQMAQQLQGGASYEEAWQLGHNYLEQITTNNVLDKKTKDDLMASWATVVAQRSTDYRYIEFIANEMYKHLGGTSAMESLNKTLFSEHKEKASRYEGQVYAHFRNQVEDLTKLPLEQRQAGIQRISANLQAAFADRTLSIGRYVSLYDSMFKPSANAASMSINMEQAIKNGQPVSLNALAVQNPDVSQTKIRKAVRDFAAASPDNSLQLLHSGRAAQDPATIDLALTELGKHVDLNLRTLSFATDEQGNIPESTRASVQGVANIFSQVDDEGKKSLLQYVNGEYRDSLRVAVLNTDGNLTNNLLDSIKSYNKTVESGLTKRVSATPSNKLIDSAVKQSRTWGDVFTRWGGNNDTHQAQLARASTQVYTYLSKNTGLLSGDTESDAAVVASYVRGISNTIDIPRQGFNNNIPVTILGEPNPTGASPLDLTAQEAGVNREFVEQGFKDLLSSTLDTVVGDQNGLQSVDSVFVSPDTTGAFSQGYTATIQYTNKDGLVMETQLAIPLNDVVRQAQASQDARLKANEREAVKTAGSTAITVVDTGRKGGSRAIFATIEGQPVTKGLTPRESNELLSTMAYDSGFSSQPKNGKIGFGLPANGRKEVTVDQSLEELRNKVKTDVAPNTKNIMKQYKLRDDVDTFITLAEIYNKDPKQAEAVAKVLQESAPYQVSHKYKKLPIFKNATDAQNRRWLPALERASSRMRSAGLYTDGYNPRRYILDDED